MRRVAPALLLVLTTSGCFRALRAWELRGTMLDEELRAESFPVSPQEGVERIALQASVGKRRCTADAGCSACTTEFCFTLDPSDGGTRVTPD